MAGHTKRNKLPKSANGKRTAFLSDKISTPDYKAGEDYKEFNYRKGVWERPHPLLKVPGTGNAVWEPGIGRWVVYQYGK